MKPSKFTEVKAYLMGETLLLSLSSKWIEILNGIPTFEASLSEDGKLTLQSKEAIKQ